MDHSDPQNDSSRSTSLNSSRAGSPPESPKQRHNLPVPELPLSVMQFFSQVDPAGFPSDKNTEAKVQPWKARWSGPEVPPDGKLIVACPKKCAYGSSNLGGY